VLRPLVETLAATKVAVREGGEYVRRARVPYVDRISSYDLDPATHEIIARPRQRIAREHSHRALCRATIRNADAEDDLDHSTST
jgi:hypothetical protein